MAISISDMLEATQLTRGGRLTEATQAIRRALGWGSAPAAPPRTPRPPTPAGAPLARFRPANDPLVVDTPFRDLSDPTPPAVETPAPPQAPTAPARPARPASFTGHVFEFAGQSHAYRLYLPETWPATPGGTAPAALPLVVLLHGCKQDAADFAKGTAMNALAEAQPCMVLYPEQRDQANRMRCWNWFEPAHQTKDAGEPGMIAALTRSVMKTHHADPARIYIAGLSAGGAMAALVAGLHPDLFAAVGVHSGLPTGAASDVVSAFSAMRRGSSRKATARGTPGAMPTVVFHGSADKTVHPGNGDQVTQSALQAADASGLALHKTEHPQRSASDAQPGERSVQRTVYSDASGKPYVEHWAVAAGPHAWSGGNAAGSFTDPQGPDASRAMLAFFLQHKKA